MKVSKDKNRLCEIDEYALIVEQLTSIAFSKGVNVVADSRENGSGI